jgi:hypothetical protein
MKTQTSYRPLGITSAMYISEPIFDEKVKYNPITKECSAPNKDVLNAVRAYMASSTTSTTKNDSDWSGDN